MQERALAEVHSLGELIRRRNNPALLKLWRTLQTSDHFYYMCTKWFADGDVHAYFSPYESPYEAFINYMNVLSDVRDSVLKLGETRTRPALRKTDTRRPSTCPTIRPSTRPPPGAPLERSA